MTLHHATSFSMYSIEHRHEMNININTKEFINMLAVIAPYRDYLLHFQSFAMSHLNLHGKVIAALFEGLHGGMVVGSGAFHSHGATLFYGWFLLRKSPSKIRMMTGDTPV